MVECKGRKFAAESMLAAFQAGMDRIDLVE